MDTIKEEKLIKALKDVGIEWNIRIERWWDDEVWELLIEKPMRALTPEEIEILKTPMGYPAFISFEQWPK